MKNLIYKELDDMMSSSELRNLMLNIGAAIRKLRIQKGYKCAEYFAFEYQLNRSAYYGWENGKNISIKKLILVCEALDISLLEFFQVVKIPARSKRIRKVPLNTPGKFRKYMGQLSSMNESPAEYRKSDTTSR